MKIKYPSFSQDLQNIWKTKDRPICILSLTSSYSIHCLNVRSIQSGHRCNATNRSKKLLYAFPPLLSDMPCASKCKGASNRKMILVTHSCNQFSTSENVHSRAPYFVKSKEHSQTSFRKWTSISNKQCHEISGDVEHFRKNLALSEISKTASHLITGARQESTTTSHKSAWRKWVGWCSGTKFIHFGVI